MPIVALSQLSRAPETRSDHRPQLSDLRESGALEQDADVVMFIYREEQYRDADGNRTRTPKATAEIIIGKQRNGPVGTAKLAFIKEHTRFENLAQRRASVALVHGSDGARSRCAPRGAGCAVRGARCGIRGAGCAVRGDRPTPVATDWRLPTADWRLGPTADCRLTTGDWRLGPTGDWRLTTGDWS